MLLQDSQATNNVNQPAAGGTGTGETFIQRMKRMKGQQQASMAGVPTQGQQTSPYEQAAVHGVYHPPTSGMQKQVYGDGQQFAPSTSTPPSSAGTPSTPVTGNGKIPDPQPMKMAAPSTGGGIQAQAAGQQFNDQATLGTGQIQPQPQSAQPQFAPGWQDAGNGMVRNTATGQMVPISHPIYQTALSQAGMTTPAGQQTQPGQQPPAQAPGQPPAGVGPMPTRPEGTELGPMDLGNDPYQIYNGSNITQFTGPNQTALASGQANLGQAILGNPESMSPDVINAMKNANKETALLQAKQNAMRANSDAASRGISDSGTLNRIYDTANSNILSNNRQIDTDAAQTNFQNKLQSLSAIDNILNSGMSRATSAYTTGLAGQTASAADKQAAVESANAAKAADLNRKLSQFGINSAIAGNRQQNYNTDVGNYFTNRNMGDTEAQNAADNAARNRGLDIQDKLGVGGLNLDQSRLTSANSQFDKNYGLDILRFLEQQREANNNLGFNYTQLNTNGQRDLISQIMGMLQ